MTQLPDTQPSPPADMMQNSVAENFAAIMAEEAAIAATPKPLGNPRTAKGILWDRPANETIPDAPDNIDLWEHCLEMSCATGNYRMAADLLGIKPNSVASACCNKRRGGQWPEHMLPGGVNRRALAQAQSRVNKRKPQVAFVVGEDGEAAAPKPRKREPVAASAPAKSNNRVAQFPTFLPQRNVYAYMEDPVVWCKEKHPFIESKKRGQVPFEPWFFQKEIMRAVMAGGIHLIMKSRQVAVTTPIMVAFGHALLYQYQVTGKPFHAHVFANKEDKALGIVKKARLAVWKAEITPEERACLKGCDPATNVKKTFYREPGADNHILCHTTTGVDIRGDDVNCVLIDEADFIPELEKVWVSCIEAIEIGDYAALVSSINPDEPVTEFRRMFKEAEQHEWNAVKIDWRANEERLANDDGAAWEAAQRKQMGDASFDVAHALKIRLAGSSLVNVKTLRRYAAKTSYIGNEPQPGHRYTKGLDIGGQGANDPCVFTVIDMTHRPGQVVYERNFMDPPVKVFPGEEPLEALRREIEEEDAAWDGVTYVDVTHNRAFVGLLKLRAKQAVQFSGGAQADNRRFDAGSGMRIRTKARAAMSTDFVTALETGELLVYENETPALWKALETARMGGMKTRGANKGIEKQGAAKVKRMGENPDHWDSAMLARLGMGRVRGMGKRVLDEFGEEIEGAEPEEEPRRGGRELQMSSPADKVDMGGRGRIWRPGDKF